jgi:uncharacterized repeat protein (TIGR03803 family)
MSAIEILRQQPNDLPPPSEKGRISVECQLFGIAVTVDYQGGTPMTSTVQHRNAKSRLSFSATRAALALAVVCAPLLLTTPSAQAQTYSVLYTFTNGADGAYPTGGLVRDRAGNLYGTTNGGFGGSYEVLFKVDRTGHFTVLHTFDAPGDGRYPNGDLIRDAEGNLYGTTVYGGHGTCYNYTGCGTVFKVDGKTGKEKVLLRFRDSRKSGWQPAAGLFRDESGNLYGSTPWGGTHEVGLVFKLDQAGTETVVHNFTDRADLGISSAGLIRAGSHIYGTTSGGGDPPCNIGYAGCGTIFKVDERTGKWTILYSFTGGADGSGPDGHLASDKVSNFYGATEAGGDLNCDDGGYGCGTVYKVDETTGKETVLYSFRGGADGKVPFGGLVRDASGNLYGTTYYGGDFNCKGSPDGCGTIFKIDERTGEETVLYTFHGGTDGGASFGGLTLDGQSNLYGTTSDGGGVGCSGAGCGVVFKLTLEDGKSK